MSNIILRLFSIFIILLAISIFLTFQISFGTVKIIIPQLKNGFNSSKVIMLAFDDSPKSQFTLAKPVLDKYGYKGNFFTVCNFVNRGSENVDKSRMNWHDIKALQQQGHDIESHTMTHTDLNNKSIQSLNYENRYDIRNWSDRPKVQAANQLSAPFNNQQMLNQFIEEVNLQSSYNKNGCINAIPIVVYHDFLIDKNHIYLPNKSFTDVGLFSEEMKYLHDNGFTVLKMSDMGYNDNNNYLYIKGATSGMLRNC